MALRKKPPTTLLLTDMSSLYGYIYCMLISEGLSGMPLYGGALYMIGRVTTVFAQTFSPEEAIYLPKALRWMRIPLMILLLLLSLCLRAVPHVVRQHANVADFLRCAVHAAAGQPVPAHGAAVP